MRRRGKCQWIMHTERFARYRHRLPQPMRTWLWMKWPNMKTIRCDAAATHIAMCDHYEGYNNLPVCAKHLADVEQSNRLNELSKSGELGRMLRDAEKGR